MSRAPLRFRLCIAMEKAFDLSTLSRPSLTEVDDLLAVEDLPHRLTAKSAKTGTRA